MRDIAIDAEDNVWTVETGGFVLSDFGLPVEEEVVLTFAPSSVLKGTGPEGCAGQVAASEGFASS